MPDIYAYVKRGLHLSKQLTVSFDTIEKVEEQSAEEMGKEEQE